MNQMVVNKGWIGVDLDGTLAQYDESIGTRQIGRVCLPMLQRILAWLAAGVDVRIITARASDPDLKRSMTSWLIENGLPELDVTDCRDTDLLQQWDDRAVQVEMNTGVLLTPKQYVPLIPTGWVGVELDGVLAHANEPQSLSGIGSPVSAMINRVRQWQMVGIEVKLFTGRAAEQSQLTIIGNWLAENNLDLSVTCKKDFRMSVFYDARSVHVVHNSGMPSLNFAENIPGAPYFKG